MKNVFFLLLSAACYYRHSPCRQIQAWAHHHSIHTIRVRLKLMWRGYCLAISRKDGQMIGNVHSFELGSEHGRQLPSEHPARMHVVFVPANSADTKVQCKNGVTDPANKFRDDIMFDQTVVAIIPSDVPH